MTSPPIRILLLNNDVIARAGVKLLLERHSGLKVIADTGSSQEALSLAAREQPDIVLLHECAENPIRHDIFPEFLNQTHKPRIILVTTQGDRQYHMQAVRNGAVGILMAQNDPGTLYKAIEKVHAGEVWLDRSLIASFVISKTHPNVVSPEADKIARLSEREHAIISLVGEGLKNQQIADQLFLSEVTVRHHLTSIYKKLGVSDRLELVIYAYQNQLAELPV